MHPLQHGKEHLLHYKPFTVYWFFPVHGFQLKVVGEEFAWISPPERVDIRHLESISVLRRDTTPPHPERGIMGILLFLYGQVRELWRDMPPQEAFSTTSLRNPLQKRNTSMLSECGRRWDVRRWGTTMMSICLSCGCVWKFSQNLLSHIRSQSRSLL